MAEVGLVELALKTDLLEVGRLQLCRAAARLQLGFVGIALDVGVQVDI